MALIDPTYLNALGDIYKQRNEALRGFGQSVLGGAANLTNAFMERRGDATQTQAELDNLQGDVQAKQNQLISELGNIRAQRERPGIGAYELAELDQAAAQTESQLRDIGDYQGRLGAIGEITPQNVYKTKMPAAPELVSSTGGKGRTMDIQAGIDATKEAAKAAEAARKEREAQAKWNAEFAQRERLGKERAADRVDVAVATKEAEAAIAKREQQAKSEQAHSKVASTLGEMQKLIDQYGDTLFASDTAFGKIRDSLGTAAGTDAQAARDLFDNLETELTEMAVEARKGTGTISDSDLAVIQRGGVGRRASSAKAARGIIDRILVKSAAKAGTTPQQPQPKGGPVQLHSGEQVIR
jgi:hypothetical protein